MPEPNWMTARPRREWAGDAKNRRTARSARRTRPVTAILRDYSLAGPENRRACEAGLAGAPWWKPPIDEDRLAELMARSNARAARDTALWLGAIIASAVLIVADLSGAEPAVDNSLNKPKETP